jgi:predicted secreted protein
MNKITGYDVEMSTKLSEAAFKAANSLNHQRVSVENSTAIAKSFGKQLQLTSKYTNMSVEEIANYITAVGDSEEVQKNLTLMSTKQKSAYATEIASLLSHARMMGMSAVETDKFVKSMTGSVSTVEEAANATASFQQLLATYGTNLTAEEKQRAALINAKTINGAPLSEGDAADAAYIEEKLIAGLKNNDVVLRAQAERDKANELQERARNTADAKLRAQLEQEATRLHTNSGATLLTMKNQIGAFHEKTAGFGKNAIDTMMSGGQLEAKKADAEVRNRYEKELKMSHNASTELATQIGELSEAIVKLDAYVSGASKSVIGGIVSTAAEVAGAGLLLKVGPAVATATTAAVAETGLLAGAGTALATAATGVMAVVTAPEVLAAVGLVAAGTAIWSSWDSLNDALTAWENEESTPVGLPKPPEVEQVDTTTQTSQEEKHAETSSKLDQVVMLLSSIVGSTREGASANKDLLNTYKTVEQDKLAASGLLEFMNNANNKSQTVAPK